MDQGFNEDLDLPPFIEEIQTQNAQSFQLPQKEISQSDNQQIILLLNLKEFNYQQLEFILVESKIIVDDLKKMIFYKFLKEKEDINELIINFHESICQGDRSLQQYEIKNNSLLYIARKKDQIILEINIIDGQIKRIIQMIAFPFYTLNKIKKSLIISQFGEKQNFNIDFYIFSQPFNSLEKQKKTLFQLSIKKYCVIDAYVRWLGGCFPNYGPITLGNGSIKEICEINKGDIILSYDYKIKQFTTTKVLEIIISKDLVSLIQIKTEQGSIITTLDHPFYTSEGWKAVQPNGNKTLQKLTLSDKLLNKNNEFVNILEIEDMNQSVQVYTLTTEYPNNFIAFGYVAHNKKSIVIHVENYDTITQYLVNLKQQNSIKVIELKKQVEQQFQIPILQQTFFNGEKIMKDDEEVSFDMNIKVKVEVGKIACEIVEDIAFHQQQNINPNQKIMNIILKESNYYVKVFKVVSVQLFFYFLTFKKFPNPPLVLLDGIEPLQNYFGKKVEDLQNFSFILIINIDTITFSQEISPNYIVQLSELKEFISTKVDSINVEQFFQQQLENINTNNNDKRKLYQQYPLPSLMAIKLWTSNLIYKRLNIDFRRNGIKDSIIEWKKYLTCLMDGLRFTRLFSGCCYRGIKNYQDTKQYQKGKMIKWNELTSFSKDINVAKRFSNARGMILIMETAASKDISDVSIYNEQECLLLPFSHFEILDVIIEEKNPLQVVIKEIPFPRALKILLWVDDNPEIQFEIIEKIQQENLKLSILFATSTEEAIKILDINKWMIFLKPKNIKIISDMVRIENYILNYTAGVDLLIALQKFGYKGTILFYLKDVEKAKQSLKNEIQFLIPSYQFANTTKAVLDFIRFD